MVARRSRWLWILPVAALGLGADPGPSDGLPGHRLVGQRAANFQVRTPDGKTVSLYRFKGKRAVVLAFLSTDCPVGNLYAPRLAELEASYRDKGVAFVGLYPNAHETPEQVAAHAREYGLSFPVARDEGNVVADTLLVERTCETLLLDGLGTIRYRGAIDDQYGVGTRKDAPAHNYLRDAIEEVITGGRVETRGTPVVGCLLDRVEPKPSKLSAGNVSRVRPAAPEIANARAADDDRAEAAAGPVTFAADVAPIVQAKCQGCHRPGEVGPFPLLTFDDARNHSAMIAEVVGDRRMPPWHADPRYGHFRNDRSLSAAERATLLAWVEQGTPLGDPAKLPAPRTFPEGWTVGTPDVVFEIPEPFVVPAQGTVDYAQFRVPTRFTKDVWVSAAEARPGDRSVVHHIIVYVDEHRGPRGNHEDRHLCGYAPGDMPSVYPGGTAKRIPAGSDLIFEIHYTPIGKVRSDRSKVGLTFATGPVAHQAHTLGIAQAKFEIPPGADSHPVEASFTVGSDAHLLSFMPHMHLRGKSFRYEAVFPDGRKEVLLSVPAYDFGWQSYYTLAEPLALPKGTVLHAYARFDNSPGNPANPDPSRAVRWGKQTWEEMMIGYIDYTDDRAPDATPKAVASNGGPSPWAQALRLLSRGAKRQAGATPGR